jgi:hypothetical protein
MAMKAIVCGLFTAVVALVVMATPMKALAHDWEWHHHHHWGWYKHHGAYEYGGYPVAAYPVPSVSVPYPSAYPVPGSYAYAPSYGSAYVPNAAKLMQLQQTMTQRLANNQMLYNSAIAQGNYPLANKVANRMQGQAMTANAASSMLSGAVPAAVPSYPTAFSPSYPTALGPGYAYNQPVYGASPSYGQTPAMGSLLHMFGF